MSAEISNEKVKEHLEDEARRFCYNEGKLSEQRAKRESTKDLREQRKEISEKIQEKRMDIFNNADKYKTETIVEIRKEVNELKGELEDIEEKLKEKREPFNEKINPLKTVVDNLDERLKEQLRDLGYTIEVEKEIEKQDYEDFLAGSEEEQEEEE